MKFQPVIPFLVILNLFITVSFAQSGSGSQFFVAKKSHLYFVEIKGDSAFAFYSPVMTSNQVYYGKRVNVLDTLVSGTGEFVGEKFRLTNMDDNMMLFANENIKHVPGKMELQPAENTEAINMDLNESYWFTSYRKMVREIDTIFPHAYLSVGEGWDEWRDFPTRDRYYKAFQVYVDSLILVYRDSLVQIHSAYTEVLNGLNANIQTLTANEVISGIQKFPNNKNYYCLYSREIINEIAEKRPELFYEVAEKAGKDQERLFLSVTKPGIRVLKRFETDSPAKKQFVRFRRKETFFTVSGIAIATLGNVAFYGTIGYFIFR